MKITAWVATIPSTLAICFLMDDTSLYESWVGGTFLLYGLQKTASQTGMWH